jgi:hypothetical protein
MPLVLAGATSGQATLQATDAATVTLTLPATSGTLVTTGGAQTIEFADGSASAPSITNSGDTNTGMFFPAADTIAFTEGGVESMRIDSAGLVGIGCTPVTNLQVNSSSDVGIAMSNSSSVTSGNRGSFSMFNSGNSTVGYIRFGAVTDNVGTDLQFATRPAGGSITERMRITSAGDVAIGNTSALTTAGNRRVLTLNGTTDAMYNIGIGGTYTAFFYSSATGTQLGSSTSIPLQFYTGDLERARIDTSGNLMVGKTTLGSSTVGCEIRASGLGVFTSNGDHCLTANRNTNDGDLVHFRQDNTLEGTISVSGTTVSYNGGHLARWSQLPDGSKDESIVKGTVLTNLDDMCVWTKDGEQLPNEQLNKMKVSDVEGDTNVAGVFVNWTIDEDYGVDDMNVAMTGDMIIRIADGVVVQKGDLLMSAGDGTAKPQGDDIVRSKTIAKVTSNYVTCTYADGSYCVPCVLMAC